MIYYNPELDIIAVSTKKVDGMDLLVSSELEETSNIYRVLTFHWEYIGEL
jgi:hypothetical protein